VEPGTFTIKFPEHLPRGKWQYCLNQLSDTGALVESESDFVFRVVCVKPRQLAYVGWALFHTHFAKLCEVVTTTGSAEPHANAYPKPPA